MNRVLIANRGAIAVRIIRTLERMNIKSVTIYHSDEKDSLYTRLSSFAVDLGKGSLTETFLNIDKIITLAKEYGCDAIHPGYGFLSENHFFAQACEENNITFIGPDSEVIRLMGLKSTAKQIAVESEVPILDGITISHNSEIIAEKLQYPILIKAVAGGGGKGLKTVLNESEFHSALVSAKREAAQYFGNDELLIEPYIDDARHIEVQILGNKHGEIIHLFERECSIQRNHQKVIEEAPAPGLSDKVKQKLFDTAVRYAKQLSYTGAGTVEFLVSGDKFWFLEMNTRIQVEHAVTELITGIDIVEEQIRIARGERFSEKLKNANKNGHAIEVRLYAENPYRQFQPSAGQVEYLNLPEHVRFDTFLEQGTKITPHFDSLLGKLVVHDKNREKAILKLKYNLLETKIYGIKTNISYLNRVINNSNFELNNISTRFIEKYHQQIVDSAEEGRNNKNTDLLLGAFLYQNFIKRTNSNANIWKQVGPSNIARALVVKIDDEEFSVQILSFRSNNLLFSYKAKKVEITIEEVKNNSLTINLNGVIQSCFFTTNKNKPYDMFGYGSYVFRLASSGILRMADAFIKKEVKNNAEYLNQIQSPLFGKVVGVKVKINQQVRKGDLLIIIESMKTENNILALGNGVVSDILVSEGSQVAENSVLFKMSSID